MPNEYGITAKEATEALTAAMRLLPPPGKEDIELIKSFYPNMENIVFVSDNTYNGLTLNWWQKWKLICQIKGR